VIVSAGGTAFLDLVLAALSNLGAADARYRLVIRSGCYVAFDAGQYAAYFERMAKRGSPGFAAADGTPENALEVWSRVISRPERNRLILGAGKRDLGNDVAPPRIVRWFRPGLHQRPVPLSSETRIVELNDQHTHVVVGDDVELRFGDFVGL
jgi:D-serine dehydratase